MKIRTKFSIASGVVVLIVITLLSTLNIWLINNTIEKKNESYVFDTASLMASQIDNWLAIKSSQMGLVKSQIEESFTTNRFQKSLELEYLKSEFILVFGTINTETGLRSNNPNRKNPPDTDFRERGWYTLGKQAQKTVFTDPYIDASTGELLLSVVSPVYDRGQFKGVIGGDLSLESIAKTVNSINFNDTGLAFLSNSEGNIITHPDAQLNNKTTSATYGVLPQNLKAIQTINYEDRDYLLYFQPLNNSSGTEWYLGVLLDRDKVYKAVSKMALRTLLFAIISIAIAVFVLRKLVKHLLMPLNDLETAIDEISSGEGDLTQRLKVSGKDECGMVASGFNDFLKSLQQLVSEIKLKAASVVSQSGESKTMAEESGGQLSTQRQMVESLTTAMHEMSTTSADVAQSAQEAASYITDVNDKASDGQRIFVSTTKNIGSLSETIDASLKHSDQLEQYSNSIEQVLSVINGIAEQTNLLALNAAIEAARAGEQGRGFAVVADEVRTLASRTQDSTTEIREMIEQIQVSSSQVQQSLQKTKDEAGECVEQANTAHSSLNEISESIKDIMDRNIQIATAAEEQSVVMEEINKNTHSINEISVLVGEFSEKQVGNNELLVQDVRIQQKLLEKFVV